MCSNVQVRIRIFLMYFLSSFSTIAKEYTFLERGASYSEVHKVFIRTTEHNQTGYSTEEVSSVCVLFGWKSELPSFPDVAVTTQTVVGSDTTSFPSHSGNSLLQVWRACFTHVYKTILLLFSHSVFQHPIDSSTHGSVIFLDSWPSKNLIFILNLYSTMVKAQPCSHTLFYVMFIHICTVSQSVTCLSFWPSEHTDTICFKRKKQKIRGKLYSSPSSAICQFLNSSPTKTSYSPSSQIEQKNIYSGP